MGSGKENDLREVFKGLIKSVDYREFVYILSLGKEIAGNHSGSHEIDLYVKLFDSVDYVVSKGLAGSLGSLKTYVMEQREKILW